METTNDRRFADVVDRFIEWRKQEGDEEERPDFITAFLDVMDAYKDGLLDEDEATEKLRVLGMRVSAHFTLVGMRLARKRDQPPAA